jgi:hypothetical protein
MTRPPEHELIAKWGCGDGDASALISSLFNASHLADDIVDMDRPEITGTLGRRSAAVAKLLGMVFVEIVGNPFFRRHSNSLTPLIVSALAYWDASNDWLAEDKVETKMFAFVHREALERVLGMIAFLVGGWEHQRAVIREVHELFHGAGAIQTFEDWRAEVANGL